MMSSNSTVVLTPIRQPASEPTLTPVRTSMDLTGVDVTSGAPMQVRAAVAGARNPAMALKTLQHFYPDAQPSQVGQFIYTDPQTGQRKLFDEQRSAMGIPVPTLRDYVDILPDVASTAGAIGGGALGAPLGLMGASAGAGFVGAGSRLAARGFLQALGGDQTQDTGSIAQQVGATGGDILSNALGEGAARLTPIALKALGGYARATADAVAQGLNPERQVQRKVASLVVADAAKKLGVPITAGMTTRRAILQGAEAALASSPTASGIMQDAAQQFQLGMGNAAENIAVGLNRGKAISREQGVQTIKDAAQGVMDHFKAQVGAFDQTVRKLVGDGRFQLPNVEQTQSLLQRTLADAPDTLDPQITPALQQINALLRDVAGASEDVVSPILNQQGVPASITKQVIRPPGMSFDVMLKARRAVDDLLNYDGPNGLWPGAQKNLYQVRDALKQDLYNAAREVDQANGFAPSPTATMGPAEEALAIRDSYVRNATDDTRMVNLNTFGNLVEKVGPSPMAWAQRESADVVSGVLQQFQPQQRDAIAASVFRDMGTATPGAQNAAGDMWSGQTFLTNWNKLRPATRQALFTGTAYADNAENIKRLLLLAESGKAAQGLLNKSGTARPLLWAMLGSGAAEMGMRGGADIAAHPYVAGGVAAGLLGAPVVAKLLTSPGFTRWMIGAAQAVKGGGSTVAAQLARLYAMKKSEPTLAEAIDQYIGSVGALGGQLPNMDILRAKNTVTTQFLPHP